MAVRARSRPGVGSWGLSGLRWRGLTAWLNRWDGSLGGMSLVVAAGVLATWVVVQTLPVPSRPVAGEDDDARTRAHVLAGALHEALAARLEVLEGLARVAAWEAVPGPTGSDLRWVLRSFPDLRGLVVRRAGRVLAGAGDTGRLGSAGSAEPRDGVGEVQEADGEIHVRLATTAAGPGGPVEALATEVLTGPGGLLARAGLVGASAELLTPRGTVAAGARATLDPTGAGRAGRVPATPRGRAVAPVGGTGWFVRVVEPEPAAHPGTDPRWRLLPGAVLGTALGAGAGWLLTRRAARALGRLREDLDRAGAGDWSPTGPAGEAGEVGGLVEACRRALAVVRERLARCRDLAALEELAVAALTGDRSAGRGVVEVLEAIVRAAGAELGILFLLTKGRLIERASVGPWSVPTAGLVLPTGRGLAAEALRTGRVEAVPDTGADGRADEPHLRAAGVRAVVAVPLPGGGGVVELGYRTARRLSPGDLEWVAAMGQRLAAFLVRLQALDAPLTPSGRRAVLRRRAALEGLELPEDALTALGARLTGGLWDLEQWVARLVAFARLTGRSPDTALVEELLRQVRGPEQPVPAPAPASRPAPFLAVVRRGATALFEELKRSFERPGVVEVIWDRRQQDRRRRVERVGWERRRADRRREPGLEQAGADYLLVRRTGTGPSVLAPGGPGPEWAGPA